MKVDKREVEHVAVLARIELSEEEKELYSEQLSAILAFFDRPSSHVLEITNAFREDELRPAFEPDETLRNAPDRAGQFFRVPKILD